MKKRSARFTGLLDFIEFTHEFREVIRVARASNAERFENDAEHSYQLAVVAWYLIETEKLDLDVSKCLRYALAHDLVEIYAGDTYIFDKNARNHSSKAERERKALAKIAKRFPKFRSLARSISEYEKKRDPESRFVYALDKLIPPIQIYMEDGKLWREKGVSLDQLMENKTPKIALSEPVNRHWGELARLLASDRKKLFKGRPRV